MKKHVPKNCCWLIKDGIAYKIRDIIIEQYSRRSVIEVKKIKEITGIIMQDIRDEIEWDLLAQLK